ncbi:MAG: hypothetical protein BWY83_03120 [bacterium ADurb.Bin478]|nr:MAG: hypothetical protein BWY83_03120 [bacterium ADurb.Bin478]
MNLKRHCFASTLSKKYLMAVTGLALLGFVIAHLAGNLQLLLPDPVYFNRYAHHLVSLGPLLWAAEIGLLAIIALHMLFSMTINLGIWAARPQRYVAPLQTKGGPSHNTLSSRHMLLLGVVVIGFIIVHVWQFKYGPGLAQGYEAVVKGETVRDLHRLVIETFQNPLWALFYTVCVIFLGFHLRHGFWSAIQSLGVMPAPLSPLSFACCRLARLAEVMAVSVPEKKNDSSSMQRMPIMANGVSMFHPPPPFPAEPGARSAPGRCGCRSC